MTTKPVERVKKSDTADQTDGPTPLDLDSLGDTGLSHALAGYYAACAVKVLTDQDHTSPAKLACECFRVATDSDLRWSPIDVQTAGQISSAEEGINHGAMAISMLVAHRELRLRVGTRSWVRSGFDFWLEDPQRDDADLFQRGVRVEVSGLARATEARMRERFKQKSRQMRPSDWTGTQGVVALVDFRRPLCRIQRQEE